MFKDLKLIRNIILRRPILCLWQITARCIFSCRICPFWQEEHTPDEELSLEGMGRIMEAFRPLAPMMISLAGGEPLLRGDLPEIVKIVSRRHYCSVITNGWLMTRTLARELFQSGMRDAMVSIDYAVPERHDRQRGMNGAFHRALRALEYLRDERPDDAHRVRILTVLMDDNIEEIEGLLLIAEEMSLSLAITLYSNHLGRLPDRRPRVPVSDYLVDLKRRHPSFDSARAYLSSFDRALNEGIPGCGGGLTFININQQGRVSRCVDRYDRPVADPLKEPLNQVLGSLERSAGIDQCRHCWTSCRGLADIITGFRGVPTYPEFLRSRRSSSW